MLAEQFDHLNHLGTQDNIEIQVLPIDRPSGPAMSGSWALLEFAQAKPVVQLEHHHGRQSGDQVSGEPHCRNLMRGSEIMLNDHSTENWRKSSYSGGNNCVEVARVDDGASVRHAKN